MINQFHVGQIVLCINGNYPRYFCEWADEFPRTGQVYTVKKFRVCQDAFATTSGLGLHLEELKNSENFYYSAERFVPVELAGVEVEEALAVAV